MPSFSTHVEVDFDWCEIIRKHSNASDIAEAIARVGLTDQVIEALRAEVAEASGKPTTPVEDRPDPLIALDRLVDDYARGLPIHEQLRRIAFTHCGRVITAIH